MSEAVVQGIVAIAVFFFYASYKLAKKPKSHIDSTIGKMLEPQNWSVFTHIIGVWVLVFLSGYLAQLTQAETYAGMFENFFIWFLGLAAAYSLLYFVLYVLFLVQKKIMEQSKGVRIK